MARWRGSRRALGMALLLDLALGDPPNRYHPVAWMGTAIAAGEKRLRHKRAATAFLGGTCLACGGAAACAAIGYLLERGVAALPEPLGAAAEGAMLKTMLSGRGLARAAGEVQAALADGELDRARGLLAWHLVSRDTTELDQSQVAAATIESVAENTSDGVVAPMLWYAILGLPGALAYRFLNTADAMLGYRDEWHEWLGKGPARLDDLANLLPARLTAAAFLPATALVGGQVSRAWTVLRRDGGKTASPNAGRPMSVVAGALGVELGKEGHYRLGAGLRAADADDITAAVRLMWAAVGLAAAVLSLGLSRSGHRRPATDGGSERC